MFETNHWVATSSKDHTLTESTCMAAFSPTQVGYQAPLLFQKESTEWGSVSDQGFPPTPSGK